RREMAAHQALLSAPPGDHSGYAAFLQRGRGAEKAIGEICPGYAHLEAETFAEMQALAPGAKFLFVMREPVARLWSGLRWNNAAKIADGTLGRDDLIAMFRSALGDRSRHAWRASDYARTLEALEAAVPADRIRLMFYETLFEQESMDGVFDFLGVARRPVDASARVNESAQAPMTLPPAVAAEAAEALRPVRDAVAARLGDGALPDAWRKRFAPLETA
ncbi:MAG: hypothetical protein AAF192_12430, partial [Pseudomonadota bacterium]